MVLHGSIISYSESVCFLTKALTLFKMLKKGKVQSRKKFVV